MGRIRIRYFKEKPSGFYWEPTPRVRDLGFSPEPLGKDRATALARAIALNDQVKDAKAGFESSQVRPGTVAELIHLYRQDDAYLKLADKTKRGYEQCLDAIEAWAGDMQARSITRKAVKAWYRRMAETTPAKAAAIIRVLRLLMQFGIDEGYREDNPATKMRLHTPGGNTLAWPDEHVSAVCKAAHDDGRPSIALAVTLAWCLGQREGDILKMAWNQYDGATITLRQGKTHHALAIPVLPELKTQLDAAMKARKSPLMVVSEKTGRAYGEHHFRHVFAEIRGKADVPKDYLFMGLRHTAAQKLGDAGCTEDEIRSITGHKSRQVVSTYVKPSVTMAQSAITKLASARLKAPQKDAPGPK